MFVLSAFRSGKLSHSSEMQNDAVMHRDGLNPYDCDVSNINLESLKTDLEQHFSQLLN